MCIEDVKVSMMSQYLSSNCLSLYYFGIFELIQIMRTIQGREGTTETDHGLICQEKSSLNVIITVVLLFINIHVI